MHRNDIPTHELFNPSSPSLKRKTCSKALCFVLFRVKLDCFSCCICLAEEVWDVPGKIANPLDPMPEEVCAICAPAVVAGQLNHQAEQMQETHLKLLYALCHWDPLGHDSVGLRWWMRLKNVILIYPDMCMGYGMMIWQLRMT